MAAQGKDIKSKEPFPFTGEESIIDYLSRENDQRSLKFKLFCTALLSPEIKDSLLITWLKQFKDNIIFLKKENEDVMYSLLRLDWVHKSSKVVSQYQELILNAVSAHPFYLINVLEMLIRLFSTGYDGTDYVTEKEKELFSKGHHLLKEITTLVPMSATRLCNSVLKNYPYMRKDTHIHVCYVTNVLEMCSYLPLHRPVLIQNIMVKLLQIDVLCTREQIEMDESDYSDAEDDTFSMDHDGTSIHKNKGCMANPLSNTLDVSMDCLIQYTRHVCHTKDKGLHWESTKKFFKEILTLFDKVILPTHGSVHIQFILFYLCSLKQDLQEAFIDYLWKKVQNPNTSSALRQVAMFYVGSYLARASYVTVRTVAVCLDLMCLWIHQYIDAQCDHNYPDASAHSTFYAVCQTVFYIFSFRHKELIKMKRGMKFLRNLNFERIISCRLNPLKVCLPAIVQNFSSITRSYQLAYCYTVVERNNRNVISRVIQSANGTTQSVNVTVLHTFFPFDPYLLKRSRKWIEPLYRVYDAEAIDPMDDQEDFMLDEQSSPSPRKPSFTNFGSALSMRPLFASPKS